MLKICALSMHQQPPHGAVGQGRSRRKVAFVSAVHHTRNIWAQTWFDADYLPNRPRRRSPRLAPAAVPTPGISAVPTAAPSRAERDSVSSGLSNVPPTVSGTPTAPPSALPILLSPDTATVTRPLSAWAGEIATLPVALRAPELATRLFSWAARPCVLTCPASVSRWVWPPRLRPTVCTALARSRPLSTALRTVKVVRLCSASPSAAVVAALACSV